MHLTRAGYNLLVTIWLVPLIIFDFIGNTVYTGNESEYFYYKTMVDGLLAAYAFYQMFRGQTASAAKAQVRQADADDDVVSFEKLGSFEYIYCAILTVYSAFNWYSMHQLNSASTGIVSVATLVWSFLSLAIAVLSIVQFWALKSGAIVELKHKVIQ